MALALEQLAHITGLSTSKLEVLKPLLREKQIQSGAYFIHAGDIPETIALVTQGLFRFFYLTYDGRDVTKSFCMEGDFIGVYGALLTRQPATYTVEALETSTVLTLPFAVFLELSRDNVEWLQFRLQIVEQLYLKKEQRERQLLLYDATTRYQQFLEAYPTLASRVKQYHIASYLGISPVSLSRIRANLSVSNDGN